CARFTTPHW
nr:immunoglobulin heavy chain junction region [Mus musculus]MBK4187041.1 immunoglobulin heavy chain junction region [Mus musculus]MBK4187042.1 immunoglobulin heavy chain junction region [Mus musculus]